MFAGANACATPDSPLAKVALLHFYQFWIAFGRIFALLLIVRRSPAQSAEVVQDFSG
jgi:hypothetical protein